MSDSAAAWSALSAHLKETSTLNSVVALLSWDQQTMMPPAAAQSRGEQLAMLSKLMHEKNTDPRVGEWLAQLSGADLTEVQAGGVRNVRRGYERSTCLSADLVERLALAETAGFEAWIKAKQNDDFASFAPHLQHLLDLTLEKTQAIDPSRHPYDVLLDTFDYGMTVEKLRPLFARLRDGLVELLDAVAEVTQVEGLPGHFDVAAQRAMHDEVLRAVGYDMGAGRMDPAEHPFTVGISAGDVRITTHLYDDDLLSGLGGTVHEAGHGMYEQGLPLSLASTGTRHAASLGLHESQSRFWENFIGRSQPFFEWMEGPFKRHFPGSELGAEDLYRAANRVEPGLIRVSADEVTYNLHIIVRFEIELELLEGTLKIEDLPRVWNERYVQYLGILPPNDAQGVLQDVHWSGGMFGYFPSYTLGNLYAASFGVQMQRDIPDLWELVRLGDFAPVLAWLRKNVHDRAHIDDAPDIVRAAVGERDPVDDLLNYLWNRHGEAYGVSR